MSQIMTEHITIRSAVPENMAKKYFMKLCGSTSNLHR